MNRNSFGEWWRRLVLFCPFAVFVYSEIELYEWRGFLQKSRMTDHAMYGIKTSMWWSATALGVVLGLCLSDIVSFDRRRFATVGFRVRFVLATVCVSYISFFRSDPWSF